MCFSVLNTGKAEKQLLLIKTIFYKKSRLARPVQTLPEAQECHEFPFISV